MAMTFEEAAVAAKALTVKPSDEDLLELYSLFKQAKEGDCNTTRPGMFDLKGKAKWDAWDSRKGMCKDDAKTKYIEKVKQLMEG